MKITNTQGLSDVWVEAVKADDYDKVGWRSITGLVAPPQQQILLQRHDNEVEEDVTDRIWMLLGSACHVVLERAAKDSDSILTETRFTIPCLDKEISLKPDRVEQIGDTDTYHLKDFKISTIWSVIYDTKPEWKAQCNLYSFALRSIGIDVVKISVELLCRDWSKSEYEKELDKATKFGGECKYPSEKVQVVEIEVWDDDTCKAYLEERVSLYIKAEETEDNDLPPCTDEERWLRDEQFAVMKKGGKRSTKNCSTHAEAAAYMQEKGYKEPTYYIEYRRGKSIRCEDYCSVTRWCRQYKEEIHTEF